MFTSGRIVYTLENSVENRNGESPDTSPQENELIQVRTLHSTGLITEFFLFFLFEILCVAKVR